MSIPVQAPARYAPLVALSFGAPDTDATPVDTNDPLPVATGAQRAAMSVPLSGALSGAASSAVFAPQPGRAVWVTLSGSWTGTVRLLRSTDGGTTRLPVTVGGASWGSFTANCNEAVVDESDAAATYYLAAALTAGTVTFRLAQ